MNKFPILFTIVASIVLSECQYPVNSSKLPNPQRFLVIDAVLNEHYSRVNVAWTLTDITPQGAYITPLPPQASGYIEDSRGNIFPLTNLTGGIDSTFKGMVGETYQLFIQADGETYISDKEAMPSCPNLDTLTANYTQETFRSPTDLLFNGFDVYAQLQDPDHEKNYYQWDWVHYERSFACNRVTIGGITYKVPCTPYDCWGIYRNDRINVQNDKLRNGNSIVQKIIRVPYAIPPSKYYLKVEQRAITESVFNYLKSLETQTQNTGSIFDVPAQTAFNPNVHKSGDNGEKLLGVFNVFSSRENIIIIDMRQNIPGADLKNIPDLTPYTPDPLAQAPCTESSTRTQKKPKNWED